MTLLITIETVDARGRHVISRSEFQGVRGRFTEIKIMAGKIMAFAKAFFLEHDQPFHHHDLHSG